MSNEQLREELAYALSRLGEEDRQRICAGEDPQASSEGTAAKILRHCLFGSARIQIGVDVPEIKQHK